MNDNMQEKIAQLQDTGFQFLSDAVHRYPELFYNPQFCAIERAIKSGSVSEAPDDNPAYRMINFLAAYQDCAALPSYAAVYNAYEALFVPQEDVPGGPI